MCSALEGSKDWAARVRCTDEIKRLLLALDKQSFVAQTKKKKKKIHGEEVGSRGSREGLRHGRITGTFQILGLAVCLRQVNLPL